MNRNGYRDEKSCCYFHPKQVVVGVCPLCLNERLLLLVAAKQNRHKNRPSSSYKASHKKLQSSTHRSKPPTSIHKIFAFGSLFTRLESRHCKSDNHDYDISPTPEEDSFISIKFEENGVASWEKNTVSKTTKVTTTLENSNNKNMSWNQVQQQQQHITTKETKSVIEHGKSRDIFRWRKRIGHMYQLIRWKKTGGGGVCHVANSSSSSRKVEGVKVRKNWMRTLTKRKSTTATME